MTIAQRRGATELITASGRVRLLAGPPMIAPARQFVFPFAVPGEEDALRRGSVYVEASPTAGQTFVAQCALGYTGNDVATGIWASPCKNEALIVAGGYAYTLNLQAPERTHLLPLRPVTEVLSDDAGGRLVLVGYHHVLVCESTGACWMSPRLSWEGVSLTTLDGDSLHGTGWDMMADEEVPFTLNLADHTLSGGGYRLSPDTEER